MNKELSQGKKKIPQGYMAPESLHLMSQFFFKKEYDDTRVSYLENCKPCIEFLSNGKLIQKNILFPKETHIEYYRDNLEIQNPIKIKCNNEILNTPISDTRDITKLFKKIKPDFGIAFVKLLERVSEYLAIKQEGSPLRRNNESEHRAEKFLFQLLLEFLKNTL